MKLSIVAAVLLVLFVRPALADPAQNYCFQLWPGDAESRSLCDNQQQHAKYEFVQFLRAHGLQADTIDAAAARDSTPAHIAQYCINRWLPRYTMVIRCVRRNIAAAGHSNQ